MRLATLLAKARRWRDRAVSRDDEQNTGSKNLLLLFHVKRIIVRRNIEISRLSRAWFIVVFAKRPVPVFRAVEKRDRMPASASADFFDVSSRSPQKRTQKNARQKRTYKKKERIEKSNCTWRFSASLFRHASRAKSARTTSSSSSSPALNPLLRVLATKTKKRYNTRARVCVLSSKNKKRTTLTWEVRTRFLHRRSRRAIRAPPRTRGRRNRSSVRSQGSDHRAFSVVFFLPRRKSSLKVVQN